MRMHPSRTPLAAALALCLPGLAAGAPTLSTVVAGTAQVTQQPGATTLVTQGSDKAILEWRNFSIASGETVRFQQPGAGSVALNRVIGTEASSILGSLTANGKVFLVNPNGILFGAQSRVDVGSLVASTLDIADQDFLAGRYQFAGAGSAAVLVDGGVLTAGERGAIALLGAAVTNTGTLTARLGTVAMAAGAGVTLDFNGDGLTRITVQPGRLQALVENGGAIHADGGQVVMTAASLQALAASVVNHGALQANALVERNGKLVLDAGAAGAVDVTGALVATGAHGGDVILRGQTISLAGTGAIDVRGDAGGGTVHIDGAGAVGLHGTARADALTGSGGTIATTGATLDATGFRATASSGAGPAGSWILTAPAVTVDDALAASVRRTLDANTNTVIQARGFDAADIVIDAAIRKTTSGAAALVFNAGGNIVMASNAVIAAAGGARIDVDLNAGAQGAPGAIMLAPGASIASGGGSIALYGGSDKVAGFAGGNAILANGILIDGATLDARSCQCDTRPAGAVTLRGAALQDGAGAGVAVVNGSRITGAGNVTLTGVSGATGATGLVVRDARLAGVGGGALTLLGRGASGVMLTDVDASTAAGPLTIAGEATGNAAGVAFDGVRIGATAMQGDVAISALNRSMVLSENVRQPMLVVGASHPTTVRTGGAVNLRPGGVDAGGLQTSALDVPIDVGGTQSPFHVSLPAFGFQPGSTVIIGSNAHRGTIEYGAPAVFDGDLTLQNGGAGSGGIRFAAPLSVTGLATLSSGGVVASPDFAVSAGSLLLHGSGPASAFQLTHAGNRIGTLAAMFDSGSAGDVDVADSLALVLGPLHGLGFSDAAGAVTAIDAATSRVAGNLLVRAAGRLALAQDIASLGGDVTLVAGTVFDNRADGAITVAPNHRWQVRADTWVGEERGALAATQPQPNVYNCADGAACGAITGNRFIYRQQPTVTLTGDALARTYGDANPAFTYAVTGLVNGDSATAVLSGAFGSAATAASNVGSYTVPGSFTSPVGYAVVVRAGTLAVHPAALLVAIDDQRKVYGGTEPRLSASYTGLKLADTGAVVTGLQLAAPTGPAATAGSHAITGSGAMADNYAISYRAGTLTVAPALLTYTADPAAVYAGAPVGNLGGAVTGFVYGETQAGATTGTLAFTAPAGSLLAPGTYAVQGSGLAAQNYVFAQAPGNGQALVVQPVPIVPPVQPVQPLPPVQPAPLHVLPAAIRDVTFASSSLYDQNIGALRVCVGAGTLAAGAGDVNDALGVAWSRVRVSPNLTNCFSLGPRNGCNDF